MTESDYIQKYAALRAHIAELGRCAVAFSAGVDSTLLLAVAHDVCGDDVLAITIDSPVHPQRELAESRAFCCQRGIRHVVLSIDEFEIPGFADNTPQRCYLCKHHLFTQVIACAAEQGYSVVLEGSNADDIHDYRPGFVAVTELGVVSPLLDAGLTKDDIRKLSAQLDLPTSSKQSLACLASRFPTNTPVTRAGLELANAAEEMLLDEGFSIVRVRMLPGKQPNSYTARIEVGADEVARFDDGALRTRIEQALLARGFDEVIIDPRGYRTGSMNNYSETN